MLASYSMQAETEEQGSSAHECPPFAGSLQYRSFQRQVKRDEQLLAVESPDIEEAQKDLGLIEAHQAPAASAAENCK